MKIKLICTLLQKENSKDKAQAFVKTLKLVSLC